MGRTLNGWVGHSGRVASFARRTTWMLLFQETDKANGRTGLATMSPLTEESTPASTWRALAGSRLTDARAHLVGPSFAASACGTAGSGEPAGGDIEQARKLLGVAERDTDQLETSASGL